VTDEMYEKIVYGGSPHFSPGSVASVAERTITSNGLSKAFAMTGWRVGYCAGSGAGGKKVIDAICKLQGQMTTCLPAFIYPAIRAAFAECAADVERMRLAFASRAALISELAAGIPGVSAPRPTGAFYLFCDIAPHLGKVSTDGTRLATPADFAAALLREHRVALVPGEDFGGRGMQSVRISFACSEAQIREGMSRLGAFVSSLK
jgi:aspartate aminotransferase